MSEMYRVIDIVSIDVMSITGYHPGRKPREKRDGESGRVGVSGDWH
jgi:hypothetical protein